MALVKILLLYETLYPDIIGGVEHRNHEMARALARRGHQVTSAGFGTPRAAQEGVRFASLGPVGQVYGSNGKRNAWHSVRFALGVHRIDLREFDVVETPNMHYLHLFPLARACRRAGKPLVVTWYEYWSDYWKGYVGPWLAPFCQAIERRATRVGSAVAATSRLTAGRLARARGRDDISLLPCGIDNRRLAQAAARRDSAATPLVYAGRLIAHKRVDVLLDAVASMSGVLPGAPLLTVFGDGPVRGDLERRAAALGLASRVTFRGFLPASEEVWRAIAGARLAVQPSSREGFGLFPLEALAVGVPVVYCDSAESAVGELVRDGIEGRRCPADSAALARCLAEMLSDTGAAPGFAARCRARAAEYDWDRVAGILERICARCRERRSPASDPLGDGQHRVAAEGHVDDPADTPQRQ